MRSRLMHYRSGPMMQNHSGVDSYNIIGIGERKINVEQAAIVRRIFTEAAAGRSGLKIAATLNREGIKGPRGKPWGASTITGNKRRGSGILHNEIYIGKLVYGRTTFPKDPSTGRRVSRLGTAESIVRQDVPHLRIVDDALWAAVQALSAAASAVPLGARRRPRRPLSGLLTCSECGGSYIIAQGEWCACAAYKARGTCGNKRMIKMSEIENRVFEALKTKLMAPETVAAAIEAHRIEHERLSKLHAKDRREIEREIGEVKRRLARLMESIETGAGELSELLPRQRQLVARRRELEAKLPDERKTVALHPNIANRYEKMIENIGPTLMRGDAYAHEAVTIVRSMITSIVVRPEPDRMSLEVIGDLAVLFGATSDPANVSGGCGGRI